MIFSVCVCVCVCLFVFIKLQIITAQYGPCHPSFSIPLALVLPRGNHETCYENRLSDATNGMHFTLHCFNLTPERLALPSMPLCYSLDILG